MESDSQSKDLARVDQATDLKGTHRTGTEEQISLVTRAGSTA